MSRNAREVAFEGSGDASAVPERTCAVTRARLQPDDLIRFVRAPNGEIVPDLARRLPGRGVWLTCSRAIVEAATENRTFERSLRGRASMPDDLPDLVDRLMTRRVIDALSLANKAGLVVTGFVKTQAMVEAGRCAALIHARDAAEDGIGKLDRAFRAVRDQGGKRDVAPIVTCLRSEELSLAMGRANVVHAALASGGAGRHFLNEAERLRRYREATGAPVRGPKPGANTEKA